MFLQDYVIKYEHPERHNNNYKSQSVQTITKFIIIIQNGKFIFK